MASGSRTRIGRALRAYLDTSVFGGVHDDEFRVASERFFSAVRPGSIVIMVSRATTIKIASAPEPMQETFRQHAPFTELVANTAEAARLADAYLAARVVRRAARVDALHVASASVARADVLVSWNFRDIVQLHRLAVSTPST